MNSDNYFIAPRTSEIKRGSIYIAILLRPSNKSVAELESSLEGHENVESEGWGEEINPNQANVVH